MDMDPKQSSRPAKARSGSQENILSSVRKEIDALDEEIVELLNRRARISRRVGRIKAGDGGAVFKPAREQRLLDLLAERNPGPLPEDHLRAIYREILASSRNLQYQERVVYLGPEGTFSFFAGQEYLGRQARYAPQSTIAGVFAAVHGGEADLGVVPLENSSEGAVGQTLDLFLAYPLHIQAELFYRVSHGLLSAAGSLAEIAEVYSHPQALAQCADWLAVHLPQARQISTESTAAAAQRVARKKHCAAVGHVRLAELFDLQVLAATIEDQPDNWTRFCVIARAPLADAGNSKTSVLFTTPDKPGSLAQILNTLAEGGINLSKLESRPLKSEKWKYVFFADLECDLSLADHAATLARLQNECLSLRLLGSYPPGPHLQSRPSREAS